MQTRQVTSVPKIQTPVKVVNDNAIHYGYVAYRDINLTGSLGIEHQVQPGDSPYRTVIPCRQLIPFVEMTESEQDIDYAASVSALGGDARVAVKLRPKSAKECVMEMVSSYEKDGFKVLPDLTGYPEEESFHIFQTVQPFYYSLLELPGQLQTPAQKRIAMTEPYTVEYGGVKVEFQPLPESLKPVAENIRKILLASAKMALENAIRIKAKTVQKMTMFFSTGSGKSVADPLDDYIFGELGEEIPQLVDTKKGEEGGYLKVIAEGLAKLGQKPENAVNDALLARLEALESQLSQATASTAKIARCQGITGKGNQCKNDSVKDGLCALHQDK